MAVFHLHSYRDILQQKVKENSQTRGYKSHLSKVMGIQSSQFSQVLAGKMDLSADQASRLCDEWKFEDLEAEYFITLTHLDRASSESLKARILKRLGEIRQAALHYGVSKVLSCEIDSETIIRFFSSWLFPAVYGVLAIPGNHDEASLAKRLDLSTSVVRTTLLALEEMNMVTCVDGLWKAEDLGYTHPSRSVHGMITTEFHKKAHEIYLTGDTEVIHFGSLAILSTEQFQQLRQSSLALIQEYVRTSTINSSKQDEVVVLGINFFRIGRA